MKELTIDDLEVGKLYRGKRCRKRDDLNDDRIILYINKNFDTVQYDSYFVTNGRNYPKTTIEKFLKWAKHEVVNEEKSYND